VREQKGQYGAGAQKCYIYVFQEYWVLGFATPQKYGLMINWIPPKPIPERKSATE